ncbi:hypothetical protein J6590_089906 [Homalodisca vitripennis]|nr:hypothetical protein J6590_089906 [Homalodisca vitripennis]
MSPCSAKLSVFIWLADADLTLDILPPQLVLSQEISILFGFHERLDCVLVIGSRLLG